MALSELDRKYDAVFAAVTGAGGRVVLDKDDQGRVIVGNFPATLPAFFKTLLRVDGMSGFLTTSDLSLICSTVSE